jgi:hypothetical protein
MDYTNKTLILQGNEPTTWLHFLHTANNAEWLDYKLPTPTIITHTNAGTFLAWSINGFFGTNTSADFLNDVIARYLLTFNNVKCLQYAPTPTKNSHLTKKTYELSDIEKQLKSAYDFAHKNRFEQRSDVHYDHVFYAIKFEAERLIRHYNGVIPYKNLEQFALQNFSKEQSTLIAKCRNIWHWYEDRDFTIPQGRIHTMTRSEAIKIATLKRSNDKKNAVEIAIKLLQADGLKVNANSISKKCGVSNATAKKYMAELLSKATF